ncbi:hypothetical protein WA026_021450 [Henosepilachna vigintioctopunctata]|uniref:Receptor ligand binding region domain-containing protein n=1 Tax=Henosepilachna vigintioctopunctata TaxID=420089 RepID=A0AAW1TXY3_9CUCU
MSVKNLMKIVLLLHEILAIYSIDFSSYHRIYSNRIAHNLSFRQHQRHFSDFLTHQEYVNYRETHPDEVLDVLERHRVRHHHDLLSEEIFWPIKKEAIVNGDLVLGGLMMVHEREDTITCGPVMPQGGIQALEAMLYTLDRLNNDPHRLLPNISIGAHILDDCDKDTYGLEMAVDFIKGKY